MTVRFSPACSRLQSNLLVKVCAYESVYEAEQRMTEPPSTDELYVHSTDFGRCQFKLGRERYKGGLFVTTTKVFNESATGLKA